MNKRGTMFFKNLRYFCLVGVIALGLITIVGSNGGEDTSTSTVTGGDGGSAPTTDNLGVALTDDASALVAADTNGEILVIRDGSVVFEGSNGENIVLSYGADGYPTRMVVGGNVICYDNWDTTNNTVTMGFVLADGTTKTEHNVAVDADTLARLVSLIVSNPARGTLNIFDVDSPEAPKVLGLSNDDLQWGFSYAGTLLSAAGCGAAIGTAIGSAGISAPVVGLACASTVMYFATELALVDENNTALQATGATLTAIDVVQCAGMDVGACAGLVLEGAETIAGSAGTTEEELADEIQIVETVIPYGGGSVQVTLRWEREVDLDLHVVDPNNEEIYYSHTTSASGGYLDHDDTDGGTSSEPAIENVYWESNAPSGSYSVSVNYFSGSGSTDYEIIVIMDGEISGGPYTGTLTSSGETKAVTTFTYSGS